MDPWSYEETYEFVTLTVRTFVRYESSCISVLGHWVSGTIPKVPKVLAASRIRLAACLSIKKKIKENW